MRPHLRPILAAVLLTLTLATTAVHAGVNLRAGFATLDPDVAARAEVEGIGSVTAGIGSDSGFGLGVEFESRRVAFGLELFRTEHSISYGGVLFGVPVELGDAGNVELLTALLALRYRINPDSRAVISIGPVIGGIGYTDFELPDGDTEDGGTAVFGGEIAVDLALGEDQGWFLRGAYRLLDADLDIDEDLGIDVDIDEEITDLLDTPLDPTLLTIEIGYRFGGR